MRKGLKRQQGGTMLLANPATQRAGRASWGIVIDKKICFFTDDGKSWKVDSWYLDDKKMPTDWLKDYHIIYPDGELE